MSKIQLKHLLVALMVGWAVCCVATFGGAILAYIALQAGTSGVFAWAILKSLKKHANTSAEETVLPLTAEKAEPTTPQLQTTTQAG